MVASEHLQTVTRGHRAQSTNQHINPCLHNAPKLDLPTKKYNVNSCADGESDLAAGCSRGAGHPCRYSRRLRKGGLDVCIGKECASKTTTLMKLCSMLQGWHFLVPGLTKQDLQLGPTREPRQIIGSRWGIDTG